MCVFVYHEHVPGLFKLSSKSSSSFFVFLGIQRWRKFLFGEWARFFSMLAQYGSYRVYDKGMKSAGAEGGWCFTVGLHIFPVRVRTAANISQEFPGNEGAESTCWTQETRLAIF